MNASDRTEFDVQLNLLCAGYNVPPGDRPEAYWKGMQKMSMVDFARCVEWALGEEGPEKMPTTSQVWKIKKDKLRARGGRYSTPEQHEKKEVPFDGDKWDLAANGHLMAHLMRIALTKKREGFIMAAHPGEVTAIYLAHKKAWATDMREWADPGPTSEQRRRAWNECMGDADKLVQALAEPRAAAA